MQSTIEAFKWSDPDWVGMVLSTIGLIGAAGAFILGLLQYRRAQLWKRKEFVAQEMKDFFADPHVRNALLLIDWYARRVNIALDPELPREKWPAITRGMQVTALMPHTMKGADIETAEGADTRYYSATEVAIRDTYDALLDSFERFAGFVEAGLVEVADLRPYLAYWISDIASTKGPPEDLQWTLVLLCYITFYRFDGTVQLFERFGHDIRVEGKCWQELVAAMPSWDLTIALENECQKSGADARRRGRVMFNS